MTDEGLAVLPRMGMIIPDMGRSASRGGLADALFTSVQQRVLGLLYGQPHRSFQSGELIRLAKSGTGAVHRRLERLADVGLLTVQHVGNQKHYQANRKSPVFRELHGLILKTVGLQEPLRHALKARAAEIRAAFVYGSIAKGSDTAGSDIDLMVISDSLRYADLFEALQKAEAILARTLNPTVLKHSEWRSKRSRKDSFAARISSQPKVFIIGSDDALD